MTPRQNYRVFVLCITNLISQLGRSYSNDLSENKIAYGCMVICSVGAANTKKQEAPLPRRASASVVLRWCTL